jgi:nitroreductase
MEAGHAAQNVLLTATALGLAAYPLGAFEDARVAQVLRLGRGEAPVYLVPVGAPRFPVGGQR